MAKHEVSEKVQKLFDEFLDLREKRSKIKKEMNGLRDKIEKDAGMKLRVVKKTIKKMAREAKKAQKAAKKEKRSKKSKKSKKGKK
jgi:hypothetical protein